jgi:hypothetical protein
MAEVIFETVDARLLFKPKRLLVAVEKVLGVIVPL